MLDTPRSRLWACALLFVLVAVALVASQLGPIRTLNHEVGDFAANSLLIQDAKRLHLIYGNYSRVGFNHPGPAILYVLAFGELIFHDWLHVVPSPLSGQLVAGCLYNAAWIVLIVALVRRAGAALLPALLFGTVAVLMIARSDHAIVNGIWFPHLYVLPYAAMLVAISRLVHGHADSLKALAVASGFLINGHVSFVPMLGVILIVVLLANWLASHDDRAIRVLSIGWLRAHRRELLTALGLLFLFFVPLLVATVRHWPGPVHDYLQFGHDNKGNTLEQTVRYVFAYWAAGPAVVCGLLLLMLSFVDARGAGIARAARALGVAFVAATVAVLFYVKVGVDNLDYNYIALFYYAVPALACALLALVVFQAGGAGAIKSGVAAVLTLWALGGIWHQVKQDPMYTVFYNRPDIPALYDGLRALPGSGRIVLDLEQKDETWGEIWGHVLGLQAYAKRRHVDLVCVNEHWHISFTRAGQCTPEEVAHNRRYDVRQAGARDPVPGKPDVEAAHLALHRAGAATAPIATAGAQ
ncbi:hypothetical protein [Massilia putida]|uniref:hypothetical protein n=1 Tax=Massilia putida TaxID=1141883 RepID=UPI000A69881B|nr:hypothetical protein [Massilia putida]